LQRTAGPYIGSVGDISGPCVDVRKEPRSGFSHYAPMMHAKRKLIGTVMLLVFLAIYAWLAAVIGAGRITLASHWAQFAYFVAAGLLWVIPAGLLIRWMQRPDQP
jgi:hypothetical protein